MTQPSVFDTVRAYLNDKQANLFTDEVLSVYLAEATTMTPRIAAGLVALSRGSLELADRLLCLCRPVDNITVTTFPSSGGDAVRKEGQ